MNLRLVPSAGEDHLCAGGAEQGDRGGEEQAAHHRGRAAHHGDHQQPPGQFFSSSGILIVGLGDIPSFKSHRYLVAVPVKINPVALQEILITVYHLN